METVRQRAQTLIWKLQKKYQLPPTLKSFPSIPGRVAVTKSSTSTTSTAAISTSSTSATSLSTTSSAPVTPQPEEEEERGPRDEWYLVDQAALRFPLPRTMLFLGNEECDIVVKSETVDKRHAVVTFDHYINRFKIKDLSTANGTYINESRIPEQEYVTLNHMDTVRLGYDSMVYHMEQGSSRGGNAPHNPQAHSHPDPLPAWASGHLARMAECQGCIAEQQIEHTCDAHRCMHQHAAEPSFVEMQRAGSGPRESSKNASLNNTWPKKKVRQFTHVAAVFSDNLDEGESVEDVGDASLLQSQPLPPPQPGSPAFYGEPPGYASDSSTPGSFSVPSSSAVDPQLYHRYCHHASTCAELSHAHAVPDYPLPPYPHTCPEHTHLASPGSGEFPPPPPPFALEAPHPGHAPPSVYPGQAGGCQQCQRIAACPSCCALAQYASKGGLPPSVKQGPGYVPVAPVPFSAVSSGAFSAVSSGAFVTLPPASFVATATAAYGHGPPGTYSVTSSTQGAVMSSYVTTAPPGGLAEGRRSMDGDVSGGLLGSSQSGKAALQTDLQTVKKGTPLYGQPSWWGEEDEEGHVRSPPSKTQDEKATPERAERKSLTPPVVPPPPPPQEAMERPRPTYMEIAATDRPTPPRSFASSLSKDSLFSPGSSKLNSPEAAMARKHSPPEREVPPQPPSAPLHDVGPGTAFTVDFGPEQGAPRLGMAQSLGEFLPAKIRKNFQVRSEKSSSKSSQQAEEESAGSPTRQRARGEEPGGEGRPLRKPAPSLTKPAPPPSKRSSLLAEGVPSLQSADLDTSTDQQTATKSTSQTSSSAKGKKPGAAVTGRPPKSPKSSTTTTATTTTKPAEGGLHPAQLTDPTSYLIDKMFEGSKGGGAGRPGARDKTAANSKYTEHKLYKEAKRYDVDGTANITTASGKKVVPKLSPQKPAPPLPPAEPPPPVPDEPASPEKEVKEEDKTSEAGTYTIENEGDEGDERDARENIDQVFGIDDMLFTIQRPVIEPSTPQNGLSPTSNEGEVTPEGLIEPDDTMGEAENGEVPRWVSQWAALTKQPSSDSPGQELADSPDSKGSRDKPPNGLSRKRPGTGRRLPSIPTDKSPVSSEYSSRVSGSPLSREVTPHQDPGPGGDAGRSKNVTISSQVNVTQYSAQSSEPTSGRSGSIDTELLLRDTEELMAAMEARMATRKPLGSRGSLRQSSGEASVNESDSDTASNVALVNGDEDFVKPSLYKSPRESLGSRSGSEVSAAKPRGGLRSAGLARESFAARAVKNRHSFPATDTSVVSDVLSESEVADTESMRSDLSANSDIESNGGFSRRGSKGKGTGTMSMTRPNRAFALRRARADGGEVETPKSAASTGTGVTGASTRRSSLTSTTQRTGRSTTRSTAVDSAKTETSLGAQIAKRGRENASLTRTDGGRHSLRSGKTAQPSSLTAPTVSSQRKSELRNLKSQLKTSSGSKGLSVRGTSARSQSQPGSRSNSPKTAERNAWERRKKYDPLKAVADAKAKAKQGGRPGSGVSSTSSRKRMTRSASFTNSEELSSRDRYAESADELSYTSGTETTGSSRLLSSHRRAFLPIHPRNQDPFSADEDDSRPYPHSSQSYDNLIVLSVYQLSSKIMEAMERTLDKLKANNRISETPSPLDDLLSNSGRSEIPAWKAANQDLAGILRHLRRIEQNLKVFDQALFPDDGTSTEASGLSTHRHSQEIQRIRGELAGFHPIHHPRTTMPVDDDEGSPELAQLGDDFY